MQGWDDSLKPGHAWVHYTVTKASLLGAIKSGEIRESRGETNKNSSSGCLIKLLREKNPHKFPSVLQGIIWWFFGFFLGFFFPSPVAWRCFLLVPARKKKRRLRDRFRAWLHSLILSITTFRTQIDSSEERHPRIPREGRGVFYFIFFFFFFVGRNLGTFGNYRHVAKIKVEIEENRSGGGRRFGGWQGEMRIIWHVLDPIPPRLWRLVEKTEMDEEPRLGWTWRERTGILGKPLG